MIENLISYVQTIISEYGAWGVFLATMVEEVIVPVPSALVPLAAGFFLLPTDLSFVKIALNGILVIAFPVSFGISIGSTLVYMIGFFGGKPAIEKSKKLTGTSWQDIQKIEEKITRGKGDEITLFILRLIPVIPGFAISGFCGVVRYSFRNFIIITFFGSFVRAFILGLIGWQVGELYMSYVNVVSKFEKSIFLVILSFLILFLGVYYFNKKNNK